VQAGKANGPPFAALQESVRPTAAPADDGRSYWTVTAITFKDTPFGGQLAKQAANALRTTGLSAEVIASSQYTTMRPGFLLVTSGAYQSQEVAEAQVGAVRNAGYADASARHIVAVREDAPGAVRKFYQLIGEQHADVAWALLSPGFQSAWQYDRWLGGYRNTRSVQLDSLSLVSSEGNNAQVAVVIRAVDAEGSQMVTRRFRGVWNLVRLEASWRLDVGKISEIP
jgi:hypothetical protein